jgi:predicted amidohydrolase YtcJ
MDSTRGASILIFSTFSFQVFLWRACWHIGVANTAALQLARVMKVQHCATHDSNLTRTEISSFESSSSAEEEPLLNSPHGGVIDLGGDGCPTGILRERAVELVVTSMGKKSPGELERFISEGLGLCLRMGLTSVQTNDASSLAVYKKLCEGGCLPIRVFLTPNYEELAFKEQSAAPVLTTVNLKPYRPACVPASTANVLLSDQEQSVDVTSNTSVDYSTLESRLVVERVKIYADGSLGAETAALRKRKTSMGNETDGTNVKLTLCVSSAAHGKGSEEGNKDEVYARPKSTTAGAADYSGILSHTSSELKSMVSRARSVGHRVEVHAIGDAAAEQVSASLPLLPLPIPSPDLRKFFLSQNMILTILSLLYSASFSV